MARPRVVKFAEALRRLADRLNPPAPPAPAGEMKLISRDELRAVQKQGLQMIADWSYLSRSDDGLLWFPTEVLDSIAYLVAHERETRERDFEAVEKNPGAVLR